ncbi:hypothetical protein C9426_21360 [Serratia sp. S1B]|nr:hypothetical protein C9426_21360 [Serratia sp. S1B]
MSSKAAILNRLRSANVAPLPVHPHQWQPWTSADDSARRQRFCLAITAAHAEVLTVKHALLAERLGEWLNREQITTLACGRGGRWETAVNQAIQGCEVLRPEGAFAEWKEALFDHCQAGITHCHGAIADTGTLILLPDAGEPRTLSLVPPCHIALLAASTLVDNFAQWVANNTFEQGMPTNLLLISGPSKTADIQQTLAYGAHGPSRLLVVLMEDC